jgi:ABC-type transport system involved in multi-copper enzyme maturation permease subunit
MAAATASRGSAVPAIRVTQARVIGSEWVKLRSLRSTLLTLAASVVITVGLGLLFASVDVARWTSLTARDRATLDVVSVSLRGVLLAQLAIGVLGILLITGEYATGMIRATISAVPRRLPVLWAKLAVLGAVAAVVSVAASVTAFLSGQAVYSVRHAGASLGDPGVLRVVLGAGLYLAMVGLLGMALGFIVRSTAGAITVLFGILLVLPVLADVLPSTWAPHIVPYLPGNAGQAIMRLHPSPDTLAPWTGFALFAGYIAVAVVAAAVLLRRRDA